VGGIGPGRKEYIVPRLSEVIAECDIVVGYKKYLQLIGKKFLKNKETKAFGMRREKQRARFAVSEALKGKNVLVVSSGDPGIYGMSGLILEEASKNNIEVEIIPGITAALAASALLGAPLICDFSVVSLSDLLVPWEQIVKRLDAAASGDMVIVIYNPASKGRTWQFTAALKVLSKYRKPETPIGIVKNGYRDAEEVVITSFKDISNHNIDMNTVIIIGNAETKILDGKMINPRGYK
jgi:precorrin-3B C17-methyltransferase